MKKVETIEYEFVVVHPLYDLPEQKFAGAGLGTMHMGKAMRVALLSLRFYLFAMMLLLGHYIWDVAYAIIHHVK